MASEEDDFFTSIGGSLMKELLADLQDDEDDDGGWLSLEQLEEELTALEKPDLTQLAAMNHSSTAAGLVVSSQPAAPPTPAPQQDAWSLSLQQFTAASQFLEADASKKQEAPMPPPPGLADLPAYDLQEDPQAAVLSQAAARLRQGTQQPAMPGKAPVTPQNSVAFTAPTPPPSVQSTPQVRPRKVKSPPAVPPVMPPSAASQPPAPQPTPSSPTQPPVMGIPVVRPTTAWQSPPPASRPVMGNVYCNPDPRASFIPAEVLASKYMKVRDINFVVHALLRPTLQADNVCDYDVQYFSRRTGQRGLKAFTSPVNTRKEQTKREEISKQWSNEHSTLGTVAKSNVARPRALIAVGASTTNDSNKQRATLWKARIYCDQAYQAFDKAVDVWNKASPGQVPSAKVQPHLRKLAKCLGLKEEDPTSSLELLLKLNKGRILLARVLEYALLPPTQVQSLLAPTMHVMLRSKPDAADDRLYMAMANTINNIQLDDATLLAFIQVVLDKGSEALQVATRMACIHAALQQATRKQEANFVGAWKPMEAQFMQLMTGMS